MLGSASAVTRINTRHSEPPSPCFSGHLGSEVLPCACTSARTATGSTSPRRIVAPGARMNVEPATSPAEAPCTCWHLPQVAHDATPLALGALLHHASVRVHTTRGTISGRPIGACWGGVGADRQRYVLVQRAEDGPAAIPESELVGVDTTPEDEVDGVAAIDAALVVLGELVIAAVDHETIDIWVDLRPDLGLEAHLRFMPHVCEPAQDHRRRRATATPSDP